MSQLARIEAQFQDYILGDNRLIAAEIAGADDAFRAGRLQIYFDAYRLRLTEVLGKDYPILKGYVGNEIFDRVADSYIATHPSAFRNLRWFGQHFAAHIMETADFTHPQVLAELARFEWTLGLAFDAQDAAAVRFEELATMQPAAWANVRFDPHPSLHLLELTSNALAIWTSQNENAKPVAPEFLAGPVKCVVWRAHYTAYFRSLEADAAWAVQAMKAGASFPEICAGLCQWVAEQDAAPRAASLLRGWVDDGWLTAVANA